MPVGDTRALRWVLCSSPLFFPAQVLKQKLVESLPLHPFAHRSFMETTSKSKIV